MLAVLTVWLGFAKSRSVRLYSPKLIIISLLLICLFLLQVSLKQIQFQYDIYPLFYVASTALAMVAGATWAAEAAGAEKLCLMVSLVQLSAAVLSVLMQCVQIAGIDLSPVVMYMAHNADTPMRAFANVAQPNQLALLLCFGLASIWWLVQTKRLASYVALGLALFLLWGLMLTQLRIAWIILPVFVLLCWFR